MHLNPVYLSSYPLVHPCPRSTHSVYLAWMGMAAVQFSAFILVPATCCLDRWPKLDPFNNTLCHPLTQSSHNLKSFELICPATSACLPFFWWLLRLGSIIVTFYFPNLAKEIRLRFFPSLGLHVMGLPSGWWLLHFHLVDIIVLSWSLKFTLDVILKAIHLTSSFK